MSKEIKTEIVIQASPEKVWKEFTNFKTYSEWNPFIKSLTGETEKGKHLVVRLEPPNAKGMTFKPKVLTFEKNKELRWLGHLFVPGLFDGEHKFELIRNSDGSTTFVQSEKFNGILVPLFKKMLDINTTNGFRQMNEALKKRVESTN